MYNKLTSVLAASAAWVLLAGSAGAQGMDSDAAMQPAMNDLEIAHSAYSAGSIDIRYAHLALGISDDRSVREFAELMIRDHAAVNEAAGALVEKLQVTPQDNELSRQLNAGAADKRRELAGLAGAAFDCGYAQNELQYHQLVNATVEERFIPSATVPELKALLSQALATFKAHEQHAAKMVTELDCG